MKRMLRCLCCGGELTRKQRKFCGLKCKNEYAVMRKMMTKTLCWCCDNTNDTCSYFGVLHLPVEGWEARRGKNGGYIVRRCPRFRLMRRLEGYAHMFDGEGFLKK